jgi:NAD(P)-dependent dehydrogenase (short-subunit alcohol dehydrogenase family)
VATSRTRSADLDALDRDLVHVPADLMEPWAPGDVNGVCRGPVAPEMMRLTTGRLAEPQEIADAAVLLCSPRSAGTTGSEVVVDSGMVKVS